MGKTKNTKKNTAKTKVQNTELTLKQLKTWYEEEVLRKDKEIERLKEENTLLMRTALKRAEELRHVQKHAFEKK